MSFLPTIYVFCEHFLGLESSPSEKPQKSIFGAPLPYHADNWTETLCAVLGMLAAAALGLGPFRVLVWFFAHDYFLSRLENGARFFFNCCCCVLLPALSACSERLRRTCSKKRFSFFPACLRQILLYLLFQQRVTLRNLCFKAEDVKVVSLWRRAEFAQKPLGRADAIQESPFQQSPRVEMDRQISRIPVSVPPVVHSEDKCELDSIFQASVP